ncbi:GAF and ANTAR domain-containing protein [Arthrobacter castelli]|uniref:GAF and ANTAR domain-containing protein n=1 Tax=Arthrobacter castelli TaxID=271431 RepID=UPI0004026A91|nr:GAF and ANTAR domain-containing protein [Arthrobacter castelli]
MVAKDVPGSDSLSSHDQKLERDELAWQLTDLARDLQRHSSPDEVLRSVVDAAIQLIPGVEEGSISVVLGRKNASSRAPSGALPSQVDDIQTELGEGPCLKAAYQERIVRVSNMTTEQRWPRFAQRAAELGVGSMLAFQLYVDNDNMGALNLYSSSVDAFGHESEEIGRLVAGHAAVAFAEAEETSNLQLAISSRDRIGQAKGILMERYKITEQQAFLMLARASQNTNIKLLRIAEQLADTGEIPGLSGDDKAVP